MKESSCHDPKKKAYCNAVRRLEDKFDGLELNHVPRKYNEDADELAKIASGRTTVPPNIFARDITKPSAEFKDPAEPGPSSTGSPGGNPPADGVEPVDIDFGTTDEAEAMEVDEAPTSVLHRHRLQVRGPELDYHRQRHPVHRQEVLGVLRQLPHTSGLVGKWSVPMA